MGKVEETACLEVADAYGTNLAGTISFLHSPPCAKHVAVGLMNEQHVDVISLQLAQALIDALGCLFLTVVRNPDLCHEEQVFALQSALSPGITNALLILVGLCRINQAIAHTQSIAHATFTFVRAYQKHPVAQCWHLDTV